MIRAASNDSAWPYRCERSKEGDESLLNALPLDGINTRITRPQVSEKVVKVIHVNRFFWNPGTLGSKSKMSFNVVR